MPRHREKTAIRVHRSIGSRGYEYAAYPITHSCSVRVCVCVCVDSIARLRSNLTGKVELRCCDELMACMYVLVRANYARSGIFRDILLLKSQSLSQLTRRGFVCLRVVLLLLQASPSCMYVADEERM